MPSGPKAYQVDNESPTGATRILRKRMAMATAISPWKYVLYPELRKFESDRQAEALRRATDGSLDFIELVGVAFALVVTLLVTRYSTAGMGVADRFASAVVNFIPLLLVLAGPFHVRRVRRSLATQLSKAHESDSKDE